MRLTKEELEAIEKRAGGAIEGTWLSYQLGFGVSRQDVPNLLAYIRQPEEDLKTVSDQLRTEFER